MLDVHHRILNSYKCENVRTLLKKSSLRTRKVQESAEGFDFLTEVKKLSFIRSSEILCFINQTYIKDLIYERLCFWHMKITADATIPTHSVYGKLFSGAYSITSVCHHNESFPSFQIL